VYLSRLVVDVDKSIRALADVIMVNVAFFLAFVVTNLLSAITQLNTTVMLNHFNAGVQAFSTGFFWLSVISLITFSLFGFYSKNRAYQSRFKAVIILQAVSVSYLLFNFAAYWFASPVTYSRSVLLIGWALTLGCILFSRLWSVMWKRVAAHEINASKTPLYIDKKKVLVIGGAGYIGSALLPKLLDAGYKVRLLDLFLYGEAPIAPIKQHANLEIIRADFRQIDKIVEAVRGVGSVIHLGAIVGDPACALSEELTIEVNLMATRMIAEICQGFHVERFVFASTCSVYGASDEVLDERSKLNPVSLYAKTKIACENVLNEMARKDNSFSPIILRFSTIFGLSGRTRFDLVVNLLTAKACFENKITVMGSDQWRPFLHVDDAAESVFCALKAPLSVVKGQVYNVGGNQLNYTLGEAGDMIAKLVPGSELLDLGMDGDRRNYRVSFNKIEKHLQFSPKWTLEQGILQVVEAIQAGSVSSYESPEFSNAKVLQEESAVAYVASRYFFGMQRLATSQQG